MWTVHWAFRAAGFDLIADRPDYEVPTRSGGSTGNTMEPVLRPMQLREVSPHCLRHTFVKSLILHGRDLRCTYYAAKQRSRRRTAERQWRLPNSY